MDKSKDASKRVAVYVRVSTLDQSCDLQRRELLAYAAARGWTVVQVFDDHGQTGTNSNRPQLKAVMTAARSRKIDLVLVWKLDRFARSLRDLVTMIQELADLGVDFVSLKDNLDLSTSAGRLMMHMIGAFAEFEAGLIRERVRAGQAAARAKGKHMGRKPSLNYDQVLALRQQGKSLREIATEVGATKAGVSKVLSKLARKAS